MIHKHTGRWMWQGSASGTRDAFPCQLKWMIKYCQQNSVIHLAIFDHSHKLAIASTLTHSDFIRGWLEWETSMCTLQQLGAGIAQMIEHWIHDWKVASLNCGRMIFSKGNFLCWPFFGVHSTPVLLQWHIKDPFHFAKIAGGRLHLNTHAPLTQQSEWADYAAVQA